MSDTSFAAKIKHFGEAAMRPVPQLCILYLAIGLTTEETKTEKPQSL
jgi:hypothetical protein